MAVVLDDVNGSRAQAAVARHELAYLDGIRGLAAVYVAVNHVVAAYSDRLPGHLARALVFAATHGRFAVAIFIVLSGYVLTIPVAKAPVPELSGKSGQRMLDYFKRRALRILPPYYAIVALSWAAIATMPVLQTPSTPMWQDAVPYSSEAFWAHLALVHNIRSDWIYRMNPPLWSVATEFQIYFFLPLVFVPIWKRKGLLAMSAVGLAIGLIPTRWWPVSALASPWLIALFVMGMVAAAVNYSQQPLPKRLRDAPFWLPAAVGLTVILAGLLLLVWRWDVPMKQSELLVGVCTASWLVVLTRARIANAGFGVSIVNCLQSRPLLFLGSFSYSIYLVHQPVLSIVAGSIHLASTATQVLVVLAAGMPATLGFAYLFHRAFERPFLHSRSRLRAVDSSALASVGPPSS